MAATVTLDPMAIHNLDGAFTITGEVSSTAGLKQVAIGESLENGPRFNDGLAQVAPNGTFTFTEKLTGFLRNNFVATATYTDGTVVQSAVAPYTFYADGHETTVTATGQPATSTKFAEDGSATETVLAGGQTLVSDTSHTYLNGGQPQTAFVFDPGHGRDVVQQLRVNGDDHDTLSFKASDFGGDLAQVIANTYRIKGVGALIVDPTTHDKVLLVGVSRAQLVYNQRDFTFHA